MERIFRTYAKEIPATFNTIKEESFANKPRGGLWGCKGTEWHDWCTREEFPCPDTYFTWKLKEDTNLYVLDTEQDFFNLLYAYPYCEYSALGLDHITSIDYYRMWKDGYDAILVTENANTSMHLNISPSSVKDVITANIMNSLSYTTAVLMALNAWDVPSINVFDPNKSVEVLSDVHS